MNRARWGLIAAVALVIAGVAAVAWHDDGSSTTTARSSDPTTTTRATVDATTMKDDASTTTSTVKATSTTTSSVPLVAASTTGCPVVPARHAPDRNRPIYTVRVDTHPKTGEVSGDLTVRFTPDKTINKLVFRLWPNGPRPRRAGASLTIGTGSYEGKSLKADRPDPTTAIFRLPALVPAGHVVEISMSWHLSIPGTVADRISHSGDSLRLGSFVPLLAWQPGVGWAYEPPTSGFAEAATTPSADWTVSIKVPTGYQALATGSRKSDGLWHTTAARSFAISVGRFRTAHRVLSLGRTVDVTVGVHATISESPQAYLDRISTALRDFAARFGAYPWSTYTMAVTPGLTGGIEFPSHVMQGPGSIGRTTPHEVGHMWFYGLVGNNQGLHPWLDEGLASYAEARVEGTVASFQAKSIPSDAQGRAGAPMTYWEGHQSSYYRGVYVQPVQALAKLGALSRVDSALRHYVARQANTIAQPDQIMDVLTAFFPNAHAVFSPYGLPG